MDVLPPDLLAIMFRFCILQPKPVAFKTLGVVSRKWHEASGWYWVAQLDRPRKRARRSSSDHPRVTTLSPSPPVGCVALLHLFAHHSLDRDWRATTHVERGVLQGGK